MNRIFRLVLLGLVVAWGVGMWVHEKEVERQKLMQTFNQVYASGKWAKDSAGKGTSGPGSTLEATEEYRAYLQQFIKSHDVKSVVDAGCGDWSFSSAIDWGEARYLGVDISSQTIELVRQRFERKGVAFDIADVTESLPSADLLLCKDVLQHLPNEKVMRFIKNNLVKGKYKWAIITDDKGRDNHDIPAGEHRLIDLGAPPFEVRGLLDLPIKFGGDTGKVAQLLDLSR
jgi:SAM-dependent methyltransferase